MKVEACKSLYDMDIKCSETALKYYPYMNRLLTSLKDYTIILDGSRWLSYMHCAGIIAGANWNSYMDHYDLENASLSLDQFVAAVMDKSRNPLGCIIMNQGWYGLNVGFVKRFPSISVGDEFRALMAQDTFNYRFNDYPLIRKADDLVGAVEMAKEITGNDMIIAYDGSYGYINCTRSAQSSSLPTLPAFRSWLMKRCTPSTWHSVATPFPIT